MLTYESTGIFLYFQGKYKMKDREKTARTRYTDYFDVLFLSLKSYYY